MPKTKVSEYSSTAGNNTDINSIDIAEGCAPSGINDAIRTLMAQLKDWQSGAVAQDNSFNGAVTVSGATVLSSTLAVTGAQTNSSSLTVTGALNANGASSLGAATFSGAVIMSSDLTGNGKATFNGSSSKPSLVLKNAIEDITVSATAATGTINYDVTTQSVLYYTSNASGNWTLNIRGSSGTSLDTLMSTGESITIAFLVTNGSTAYYQTALNIDGSAVTPKYQGGSAFTAGNASSIDVYTITVVKTGSATFTAFASQTKFA